MSDPVRFARGEDVLELAILGWDDPDVTAGDEAWLLVEVRGRVGGRSWTMVDPCLLASEAAELADWLEELVGDPEPETLEFAEPTLSFACEPGPPPVLHVKLDAGVQPEWLPPDEPWTFTIPVTGSDLLANARRLRAALADYRPRG